MAPVVLALEKESGVESAVCVSAQHRQMLDTVMGVFDLAADYDLNVMRHNQDLFDVTSAVLLGMRDVLQDFKPTTVLVHGDTTTCFAAGLAAFYEGIDVGHVEAGLRTGDLQAPFPEEANRSLVGRFATKHFAPTKSAAANLERELVPAANIVVTGNTVIDALLIARDKISGMTSDHWLNEFGETLFKAINDTKRKTVLITGHRRENFGQGFIDLCTAIKQLAARHPDWNLVYPVHLNPNVKQPVYEILSDLGNVHLIEPQDYLPFVWLMHNCDLLLTDSGGVQEEGPSLGKPVLVMRDVTERPEAVDAGTVKLVGTNTQRILEATESVLLDPRNYAAMAEAQNPYGDGRASRRILQSFVPSDSPEPAFRQE